MQNNNNENNLNMQNMQNNENNNLNNNLNMQNNENNLNSPNVDNNVDLLNLVPEKHRAEVEKFVNDNKKFEPTYSSFSEVFESAGLIGILFCSFAASFVVSLALFLANIVGPIIFVSLAAAPVAAGLLYTAICGVQYFVRNVIHGPKIVKVLKKRKKLNRLIEDSGIKIMHVDENGFELRKIQQEDQKDANKYNSKRYKIHELEEFIAVKTGELYGGSLTEQEKKEIKQKIEQMRAAICSKRKRKKDEEFSNLVSDIEEDEKDDIETKERRGEELLTIRQNKKNTEDKKNNKNNERERNNNESEINKEGINRRNEENNINK